MQKQTDRKKELTFLKNMTDDEAYTNALDDPDCPPLTDKQLSEFVSFKNIPGDTLLEKFHNAQLRQNSQVVTARFDADIVKYYKSKGKGYQSIINAALRECMEAEIAANSSRV
ncbi:MAG: BrnA antitoxin family protein [Desulfovibrio sp.]|nr:BrnA antitoxin family protein [Desulfovibrio sp.]